MQIPKLHYSMPLLCTIDQSSTNVRSKEIVTNMQMNFAGIVEEVGSAVSKVQKGDRVVAAFDFACGSCFFCKKEVYSSCDE